MRSQFQILAMIKCLQDFPAFDTFGIQAEVLKYKLTWENAKKHGYINKKYWDSHKVREEWKSLARLDRDFLLLQIHEHMFQAFEAVLSELPFDCLAWIDFMMAMVWLMGSEYEHMINDMRRAIQERRIVSAQLPIVSTCENILTNICNEFGLKKETYIQDWEREQSIIR